MNGKRFGWLWGGSLIFASVVLLLPAMSPAVQPARASAQGQLDRALPQRYTAFAANLSNVTAGPRAQTIQIQIDRWSTDGERDRLLSVLKEKGEGALLSALQKLPKVGYFRTPNSLAYDLRYARQHPWGDGGRRIFLATDRYINFWEAANKARTLDYPFTLVEMRLDNHGNGEGKLSIATKVTLEDNQLVLEDYGSQPVLLTDIKEDR